MLDHLRPLSTLLATLLLTSAAISQTSAPAAPPTPPNPATTPLTRPDAWWTTRNDAFNARTRQAQERGDIDVIFLGDSITQGWEGAGKEVWASTFAPLNAVNYGIGADRTGHVLGRIASGNLDGLATPKAGRPPRVVVLLIGTNNTDTDPPERIAEGVKTIIDRVREKLPQARVLLMAILPRGEKPSDILRAKIDRTNPLLAKLADGDRVRFLDIGPKLMGASALGREKTPTVERRDLQDWAEGAGRLGVLDPSIGMAVDLGDRAYQTMSVTAGPGGQSQLHFVSHPQADAMLLLVSRSEPDGAADVGLVPVYGESLQAPLPSVPVLGARLRPGAAFERNDRAGQAALQSWLNRYAMQTLDRSIFPDFVHLSPKAYQIWADAALPVIREMLEQK